MIANKNVLDKLDSSKIKSLKLLTKKGNLETVDNVFMDSSYGIRLNGDNSILEEYFVSADYIRKKDDVVKWQLFFARIGVNTEVCVRKRRFNSASMLYKSFSSFVDYCAKNEKNYGYSIHTIMSIYTFKPNYRLFLISLQIAFLNVSLCGVMQWYIL